MRSILPNRRTHEAFHFEHWGRRFIAGVGRAKPFGPIQEVWVNSGRSGEQMETLSRDAAVLISLGLQFGVPLSVMRKAIMRDRNGDPSGPIGKLLDLIAGEEGEAEVTADAPKPPVAGPAVAEALA